MQRRLPKIKYEILHLENDPHEANLLKLDCSKANAVLRWKNVLNLEKAIDMTIDWYQNFYENKKIITRKQIDDYMQFAKQLGLQWAEEK